MSTRYNRCMRRIIAVIVGMIASSSFAQSSFRTYGFLTLREIYVKAQPSWSTGGWGRFDVGAGNADAHKTVNVDVLQLGVDWTPTTWLLLHTDGLARREQSGTVGRRVGIVQAYGEVHTEKFRVRGGLFWFPTSLENVDPLWNSRYTISNSALNSWIGQEVRPIAADVQFSPNFYFTIGATAFRGNDTMGSELAARGWTIGNRLTVYDEVIASVPDTTRPIGPEVDNRIGDSGRIRVQIPERALLQFTHIDNRAKLLLRAAPETPWRTKFDVVGAQLGTTGPTTVAAEWAYGSTQLGFPGGSFTMDFDTVYVLLSQKRGPSRWTARVERFTTNDHRRKTNDINRERGSALTLSYLRDSSKSLRTGIEYVHAKGDRLAAPDPHTSGSTITLELRYRF
ncbi:MAG: hypothetical protein DMF59_12395 [Acidobacteria bacterium]|nr:MAG: hypothetical protein DMF59_12395 [Acidobacteriota bacterium]